MRALLEVLRQGKCILSVALSTQTQCLGTQKQLLRSKRIKSCTEISKNLNTGSNDKCDVTKGLEELEAMISFGRLVELGESLGIGSPVKLSRIDNNTSNSRAVATDPFSS